MNIESTLSHQAVLIKDGKILQVLSNTKVQPENGTIIIDGKGKFLLPGLFDMHAHFFYEQGEHRNTCENELKIMLANGLTTADILAGHRAYLEEKAI